MYYISEVVRYLYKCESEFWRIVSLTTVRRKIRMNAFVFPKLHEYYRSAVHSSLYFNRPNPLNPTKILKNIQKRRKRTRNPQAHQCVPDQ